MDHRSPIPTVGETAVVLGAGETPLFQPGDPVRVSNRSPLGHYCHRPAYWSQNVIGVLVPADDRHIEATAGSA
jgi:hypothetical protein